MQCADKAIPNEGITSCSLTTSLLLLSLANCVKNIFMSSYENGFYVNLSNLIVIITKQNYGSSGCCSV